MVQICLAPSEVVGEGGTSCIDTLLIMGSALGFQLHFQWVCNEVLKPALESSSAAATSDDEKSEAKDAFFGDSTAKKAKTISAAQDLLQSILGGLHPSLDAGSSTECWLPRNGAGNSSSSSSSSASPLKVVLGVLPAVASRHNAPGQPIALTALLKKHLRAREGTALAMLTESPDHTLSAVCAMARVGGSQIYNRKTMARKATNTATTPTSTTTSTTSTTSSAPFRVLFPYAISEETKTMLTSLNDGIAFTRWLVDAPCNELNTTTFQEHALQQVKGLEHVTTRVICGKELQQQGYGGLWGVGMAAEHEPAMVMLLYHPPSCEKNAKSICMVGKGIVFDTGGLQIKTKAGMPSMKRDMGGAAAILSAFCAIVKSGSCTRRPLHAILCLAENSVASNAMRPDDIITMYSGLTVEINNTDAEGRLVLGDGCASAAKHMNPEYILDMATLTGAQGVATGKHFAAIYTNDEELERLAVQAGRSCGDLCHPVPYAPEFFRPEFQSAFADMKNSVADRANAQVSCAGQFIANHIAEYLEGGGKWMHIDMAYPSFDKKDERATGYGVALLHTIVKQL